MDIKVVKDKKNLLLNRRELDFVVKYEGSTPSRNDVKNKLAAMLNAARAMHSSTKMQTA